MASSLESAVEGLSLNETTDGTKENKGIYEDKTLFCKECDAEWVFSAGEQEFYAEKGFENEPTRCKDCRRAKKDARNRRARGRGGRGRGGGDRAERGGQERTQSTNACYAFQRGECQRGDSCRFAHVVSESA